MLRLVLLCFLLLALCKGQLQIIKIDSGGEPATIYGSKWPNCLYNKGVLCILGRKYYRHSLLLGVQLKCHVKIAALLQIQS